jgi:hypothetical protein
LNDLAKPAAGLRRVDPIRIDRRSFEMIHLPTRKKWIANVPTLSFCVRC